jgi:hypothetical protein
MIIRKVSRWGGVLVAVLLSLLVLKSAPTTEAVVRPSNSGVFAGRFIPAFVGAAYDPSVAYQELAGLPVYVFAFDFWSGPNNPDGSWIVSNLAIRTQVRADGSFQVQGLPVASHYGVYFPFALNGGNVVRTDCEGGRDIYAATTASLTNPCRAEGKKDWMFRMPRPEDRLQDVFSYAGHYLALENGANAPGATVLTNIDSQIQIPGGYEHVRIEHAFITNKNEVDIENNINTFPVVPNSTLKVTLESTDPSGSEYEIYAVRVTKANAVSGAAGGVGGGYRLAPIQNFPVIRGRAILSTASTTPEGSNDYTFQSFAPPGYYALTTWRKEGGSPSYLGWDGVSGLNTHKSGWAQVEVTETLEGQGLTDTTDWRHMLAAPNRIGLSPNRIIVWGTVTSNTGFPLSTFRQHTPHVDAIVHMDSDRTQYFTYTDTDQEIGFVTPGVTIGGTASQAIQPSTTIRGIYAFSSPSSGVEPHSDEATLHVENPGFGKGTVNTGFIHSLAGPRRIDLIANESAAGRTNGYDNGLVVHVDNGKVPAGSARVSIAVTNPLGISVTGEREAFYTNALGDLHIPLSKLSYAGVPCDALTFQLRVTFDNNIAYQETNLSASPDCYREITVNNFTNLGAAKSERFNLAFLNSIQKFWDKQTAYAVDGPVPVLVDLNLDSPVSGQLDVQIYRVNGNERTPCGELCPLYDITNTNRLTDPNTQQPTWNVNTQGLTAFVVRFPQPANPRAANAACPDPLSQYCINLNKSSVGVENTVYQLVVQGEIGGQIVDASTRRITIDSGGVPNPGTVPLGIGQNCSIVGAAAAESTKSTGAGTGDEGWSVGHVATRVLFPILAVKDAAQNVSSAAATLTGFDFQAAATGWLAQGACSVGEFFISNLPLVFGTIYKYGLQTRALTQDQPVIQLYDVVRNIVNIVFVLIFVLIGVMTVLHYQPEQWHLRVLLPELLKSLFFANFSLLVVQAILDLNNFASYTIFQFTEGIISTLLTVQGSKATVGLVGAGSGVAVVGGLTAAAASMATGIVAYITSIFASGGGTAIAGIVFVIALLGVILVQALLILVVFFGRYLVIWMGTIAAPAVFALSVLPWFSSYKAKWWSAMLKVAFIQTAVAAVLSVGLLLLTIGSDENSLFSGFGIAIIGLMVLFAAFKMPSGMLAGAAGGFGLGFATAALSSLPSSAGALASKLEGAGKSQLQESLTDNARWEAEYKLKHGSEPSETARNLRRATMPIRALRSFGTGGFGAKREELGALSSDKAVLDRTAAQEKFAYQKHIKQAGLRNLSRISNTDLDKVLKEAPLDREVTDLSGNAVRKADGTTMKYQDLVWDQSKKGGAGDYRSKRDFYEQMDKLQQVELTAEETQNKTQEQINQMLDARKNQVRQQILRDAKSDFRRRKEQQS